jgi:hypothetical protein
MSKEALEALNRVRETNWMQNANRWPNWPIQPIRNRQLRSQNLPDIGVLIDTGKISETPKVEPVVYLVNMFNLPKLPLAEWPQKRFDSFDALLDAGWEID